MVKLLFWELKYGTFSKQDCRYLPDSYKKQLIRTLTHIYNHYIIFLYRRVFFRSISTQLVKLHHLFAK